MEMPFWVENFEISGSNAFAFRLDIFYIYLVVKLPSSTTPLPRSRSRSNCRACKSVIRYRRDTPNSL